MSHPSFNLISSLQGRLLFLICLSTLPAILFTFFVADNERTATIERTEQDALNLANLASREHTHQIRGARELLAWLGERLAREGDHSPVITEPDFLQALLAGHPQLANIGVLSPRGRVLTSAYPLASYESWIDNPAYLAALRSEDVAVGTYIISPIFNRPTFNLAYAVRDSDREVIAVLFNGLDLDWLSEMADASRLSDGFSLLIVDRDDRVLAYGGPPQPEFADAGDVRIPGISGLSHSPRGRMLEVRGTAVRHYFVVAPLEQAPGLFVAVSIPYERVLRQANTAFYRTLVALGILTLFTIIAVFTATELGVLRGLRSLVRAAQRFGAGELSVRVKTPRSHNEFRSLATAFNTMAESIAARNREAVSAQARLRALASRVQVAREKEAARISRELHDEIGQLLTSLKIDLTRLQSHCPPGNRESTCAAALSEGIAAMNQQIDAAVDFVRRISAELRPGVLDKLGLTAALEWQAREVESRTGLAIQVEADVLDDIFDELVSVTLFRIAQEAINNVVRHAHANMIEIGLARQGEQVVLTVHDDGKGISAESVESSESFGIIGMCERATLVDGCFCIGGVPGRGTTVTVTVPLRPAHEDADARTAG